MSMLSNMRKKRKEKGLSTEYMAKQLNIKTETYRAYERGERNPLLRTTIKISQILDCSINDLI